MHDDDETMENSHNELNVIELYSGAQGHHVGVQFLVTVSDEEFQQTLSRVAYAERYLRASRGVSVQVVEEGQVEGDVPEGGDTPEGPEPIA